MCALLALVLLTQAFAGAALAEEPPASQVALARQQFTAGVEAARANDWERALKAFERSQALYPHPATLFNIAGARKRLGRLVAAVEAYRRFLLTAPSNEGAAQRSEAEQAIRELEPKLAHLTIRVDNAAEGDQLALDGGSLPSEMVGQEVPVDPGAHELTLSREGSVVARASVKLVEAQRAEAVLRAPVAEGRAALPTVNEAEREPLLQPASPRVDSTRKRRRWIYISVAVAVAAVGGTVAAVLLARDDPKKDYVGNFGAGEVGIR